MKYAGSSTCQVVYGEVQDGPSEVGMIHAARPGVRRRTSQSRIECPYCHEPLRRIDFPIVRLLESAAVGQMVYSEAPPDGTTGYGCDNCLQAFFVKGAGPCFTT